ncbi:hypothetical protein KAU45_03355, partial [bacterium]|nr:hypothetical protein [bacterium]
MRKIVILAVILVLSAGASWRAVSTSGPTFNAHPDPPAEYEFYWDDGVMVSGWVWYTGGNYWAVQFDEEKTDGFEYGLVTCYGAVTYPGWPDSTFQGCYMHTFDDVDDYPGSDLDSTFLQFTTGGVFEWVAPDSSVGLSTSVFYIAFEQYGNYPSTDAVAVDAAAGTHNWTGFQGSWTQTSTFSDFMLRCYWEDDPGEDYRPPEVTGMNPDDGEEDVPVGTTIVFHVVDDLSGVDVTTIEFTVEDTSRNLRFRLAFSTGGPYPTGEISGDLHIDDIDPLDVICTFTPDDDLP